MRSLRALATLAGLAIAACVTATPGDPGNFVAWREGLASAGQPSAGWLQKVKGANYDVVINLAPPGAHGSVAGEPAIVQAQGVRYVQIPVDFRKPTAEDFGAFSQVMLANKDRGVFVHCQVNMRAASFVFIYRVVHEGADIRESLAKLTGIWSPDPVWKRFIEETLALHGKKVEIL